MAAAVSLARVAGAIVALALVACGPAGSETDAGHAAPDANTGLPLDAASPEAGVTDAADAAPIEAGSLDAGASEAGAPAGFITGVVSFTPGACGGFGSGALPGVVEGPPIGGGLSTGSTDVVSLGTGGTLVVSFAPGGIVDGPGPDFIVFENPFEVSGNPADVYAEPGEVSVSDDGVTWATFPCAPPLDPQSATGRAPPYGACAGWHPVLSSPADGISPFTPAAGGDPFDLASLGVTHARFVRVVDRTLEACPDAGPPGPGTGGFDLDAIAVVHPGSP